MVVDNVGRENTPQLPLVEDNNVIETFSTDRTDDALDVCILPWGPRCRDDLLNSHNSDAPTESVTLRSVPVPQEVARGKAAWDLHKDYEQELVERMVTQLLQKGRQRLAGTVIYLHDNCRAMLETYVVQGKPDLRFLPAGSKR